MLLHLKVYLISTLYSLGGLFMFFFPPRNFEISGVRYRRNALKSRGPSLEYPQYVTYESILDVAKKVSEHDSVLAKVRYLTPRTKENRSLVAFELHSDVQSMKPGILIVGGVNAMAWGSTNAILELTEKLLHDSNYQVPYFNDYDWYFIPMANPDGMEFTKSVRHLRPINQDLWSRNETFRNTTRPYFWNKNTDREGKDICFGTNINRNFAYHWQDDVSKTPERCSQYYPGRYPFSTAEAKALREYLNEVGDRISLAIHLHASYVPKKECILYPWRYSLRQQSNYQVLQDIGEYAARQSILPDRRFYEVHQGSSDERVAGSLSDYLSGVVGTELVFILKPYFPPFPNVTDTSVLRTYTNKAVTAILSLVRGWRSSSKQNTLYFFSGPIEF